MRVEGISNTLTNQSLNNMDIKDVETVKSINKAVSDKGTEIINGEENNKKDIQLSQKSIEEAIRNTNKKLEATDRKFEFSVNEETNDIIVKVINKETDEIIREIPSEKILDMVAKMMELAGLFVDERR